jgi:CBS domain-containing protein
VPNLLPLSQLVEEQVLIGAHRCFFVTDSGHLQGLLFLSNITAIPRRKWRYVTTGEVMAPFERLARVEPHAELLAALRAMDDAIVAQVPVVNEDASVGILSREQVPHYIRLRAGLGV